MVIDLKRCNGNGACTIACKAEQATPPGTSYALVKEIEVGKYPKAKRVFLPYICMHCKDPPCMNSCPTRAIRKRSDGIVYVEESDCATARACVMACPYGATSINERGKGSISTFGDNFMKENSQEGDGGGSHFEQISYYPGAITPYEQWAKNKHRAGSALKCNFCYPRVEKGLQPACVQTCPTNARIFGDIDDPNSEASRLIRERPHIQMLEEKGTDPSVYYVF